MDPKEHNIYYEIVGNHNQGATYQQQRHYYDSKIYMVPNAAQFDDESQYEELQISTLPSVASKKQPSASIKLHASHSVDTCQGTTSSTAGSNDKITKGTMKRRECVVICIFLTVLAVVTIASLAIGALSFREGSKALVAIDALEEDYTAYLLNEIRSLNSQLAQLNADTQGNISKLQSQLVNQYQEMTSMSHSLTLKLGATHSEITHSINQLSSSAYQVSTSAFLLSTSASWLSTSASQASTSISHLSNSAYSLSTSVFLVSSSVYWYSYYTSISLSQLSTSDFSLSSSVNQLLSSISQVSSSIANRCTITRYTCPIPVGPG